MTTYTVDLEGNAQGAASDIADALDRAEGSAGKFAASAEAATAAATGRLDAATTATRGLAEMLDTTAAAAVRLGDSAGADVDVAKPLAALARLDTAVADTVTTASRRFGDFRDRASGALTALKTRGVAELDSLRARLRINTTRLSAPFATAAARVRKSLGALPRAASRVNAAVSAQLKGAVQGVAGFARRVAVSTDRSRAAFRALGRGLAAPVTAGLRRVNSAATAFGGKFRAATKAAGRGVSSFLRTLAGAGGAGRRAAGGLRSWVSGLGRAKKAQSGTGSSAKAMLASFGGNVLAMAAAGVARLASAAGGAVIQFAAMGERARFALGVLGKGVVPGEKLWRHASALATRFGLDLDTTRAQYTEFMSIGLAPKMADSLIRLTADFKAASNDVAGGKLVDVIREINAKAGEFKGSEMIGLIDQLKDLDISRSGIAEELARIKGVSVNLDADVQAGKISADELQAAIISASTKALGAAEPGQIGAKFADTTTAGIVGRLKATTEVALTDVLSAATGAAAKALGPAATKFSAFLASPEGEKTLAKLSAALQKMVELGGVFMAAFGETFGETFDALRKSAEPLLDMFGGSGGTMAVSVITALGKALGTVAAISVGVVAVFGAVTAAVVTLHTAMFGAFKRIAIGVVEGLGKIVFSVSDWWANLMALWDAGSMGLVEKSLAMGTAIVDGIVDGIKGAGKMAVDAVEGLANSMVGSFKETLGIESPSKIFRGFGVNIGQGAVVGIRSQQSAAAGASLQLGQSVARGGKRGFGAGPSFSFRPPVAARSAGAGGRRFEALRMPLDRPRRPPHNRGAMPSARRRENVAQRAAVGVPRSRGTASSQRGELHSARPRLSSAPALSVSVSMPRAPALQMPQAVSAAGPSTAAAGRRGPVAAPRALNVSVNVAGTSATPAQIAAAAEQGGRRALDRWLLEMDQE